MPSAAAGSAASRSPPSRSRRRSRASPGGRTSSGSGRASPVATRPVSRRRLVTTARQPGVPGSSGRTCSALRASSRTTSTRRSASRLRSSPERPSRSAGMRPAGTASASRNARATSSGAVAPAASKPCRSAKSWPSGNRPRAAWCPVHGERRLAHAGGAHDGDGPGRLRPAQRVEGEQRRGTAGEARDAGRQLRRDGPAGRPGAAVAGAPGVVAPAAGAVPRGGRGGGEERVALGAGERERVGEQADGARPRRPGAAALQVADAGDAQADALGQVLLAEPGPPPVPAQELTERHLKDATGDFVPFAASAAPGI